LSGNDYAGKPRPVMIVQDDSFDATARCRTPEGRTAIHPVWSTTSYSLPQCD
jgi:hypothetical protein